LSITDPLQARADAKSAYADLFARIGKYAPGAKDIVELVLAVGKFV
jgi:hypothetical protein